MDLQLKGQRVLITGASKGIGLSVAHAFAAEGCDVVLCARDKARLDALAQELTQRFGVATQTHACDLSTPAGIDHLAASCGAVDILVNNAGGIPRGSVFDTTGADWRRGWDLKVYGFIDLTRHIYGRMKERGSGVIVNIVGMAGERPDYFYIAGASGNAALNMFTLSLGGESIRYGVRAVAVNPGPIDSDKYRAGLAWRAERQFGDRSRVADVLAEMPSGRPGRPEEVSSVVVFLASPQASYISGASIRIDGGLFARPPSA